MIRQDRVTVRRSRLRPGWTVECPCCPWWLRFTRYWDYAVSDADFHVRLFHQDDT